MNFEEALKWVTGVDGGAFLIVSWAFAWAMEDVKKWQEISSKSRALIVLGVALVLGLLTRWLITMPDVISAIEPYVQTAIYIIGAWLATQTAHKLNPKRRENNGSA